MQILVQGDQTGSPATPGAVLQPPGTTGSASLQGLSLATRLDILPADPKYSAKCGPRAGVLMGYRRVTGPVECVSQTLKVLVKACEQHRAVLEESVTVPVGPICPSGAHKRGT